MPKEVRIRTMFTNKKERVRMTAQRNGHAFVGAVEEYDFELLDKGFPGLNYRALKESMEGLTNNTPRLTDLVLIGSVYSLAHTEGPEGPASIGFLPFNGLNPKDLQLIRLPVMDNIVEHFIKSALSSEMWLSANLYLRRSAGFEIRFIPDSGCVAVPNKGIHDGTWRVFLQDHNARIKEINEQTETVRRRTDTLVHTGITDVQLAMWMRIRDVLHNASPRIRISNSKDLVA